MHVAPSSLPTRHEAHHQHQQNRAPRRDNFADFEALFVQLFWGCGVLRVLQLWRWHPTEEGTKPVQQEEAPGQQQRIPTMMVSTILLLLRPRTGASGDPIIRPSASSRALRMGLRAASWAPSSDLVNKFFHNRVMPVLVFLVSFDLALSYRLWVGVDFRVEVSELLTCMVPFLRVLIVWICGGICDLFLGKKH